MAQSTHPSLHNSQHTFQVCDPVWHFCQSAARAHAVHLAVQPLAVMGTAVPVVSLLAYKRLHVYNVENDSCCYKIASAVTSASVYQCVQ